MHHKIYIFFKTLLIKKYINKYNIFDLLCVKSVNKWHYDSLLFHYDNLVLKNKLIFQNCEQLHGQKSSSASVLHFENKWLLQEMTSISLSNIIEASFLKFFWNSGILFYTLLKY